MSKMLAMTEEGSLLSSENINITDAVYITHNMLMQLFKRSIELTPEEHREEATQEMYNFYNETASAFLKALAPQYDLRPDLTEEAILRAENEILAERAAEVTPIQLSIFDKSIKTLSTKLKDEMQKDGLIPLDSLDEYGKPVVIPMNREQRRKNK